MPIQNQYKTPSGNGRKEGNTEESQPANQKQKTSKRGREEKRERQPPRGRDGERERQRQTETGRDKGTERASSEIGGGEPWAGPLAAAGDASAPRSPFCCGRALGPREEAGALCGHWLAPPAPGCLGSHPDAPSRPHTDAQRELCELRERPRGNAPATDTKWRKRNREEQEGGGAGREF